MRYYVKMKGEYFRALRILIKWTIFFPIGTKVEGILRQSADVEEVERRVQEYEQGTSYNLVSHFLTFFGGKGEKKENLFRIFWNCETIESIIWTLLNVFQPLVNMLSKFQSGIAQSYFLVVGKTEFGSDEDAHVVGDCVKVHYLVDVIMKTMIYD